MCIRDSAGGVHFAGFALAAVFGEIAEQAVHAGVVGAVDQVAALLFDRDQACVRQLLQVEGERVAGHAELLGQHAGREAGQAGHDQRAEGAQALRMGEGAEGGDDMIFIHDSIIQLLLNRWGGFSSVSGPARAIG